MNYIPDALYQEIISCIPIACVDIAVIRDGKVLLVKRKDKPAQGQWWLPGGRVRKRETMRDTAKRKALEEVGLDCFVGPLVHTAETIFPDGPFGESVHSINSCFLMHLRRGLFSVKVDENQSGFRWVDAVEPDMHKYVKDCLLACGLEEKA